MYKPWEELTISNDFIFSKVMTTAPHLCRRMLEIILGFKIDKIEYPEREKVISEHGLSKGIRLDVYVQASDGSRHFDVEIQTSNHHDLAKRMRYYQSTIDNNALNRGQHYYKLADSYVIFICTFDYFGAGRHKYTFTQRCTEDNNILLGDGSTKIVLNALGTMNDVDDELLAFLNYIAGFKSDNEFVEALDAQVKFTKRSREWRMDFVHYEEELAAREHYAREEGIGIGREEGIGIGREEGIGIGRKEGIGIGREEERQKLVKNFLKAGTPIEFIMAATGWTEEQIKKAVQTD